MSSRRKVQMSMWKEGDRRTSPRISGLNACKVEQMKRVKVGVGVRVGPCTNARLNGPASRTRARKKRKLRPLEDVAATCVSPIAQLSQDPESNGMDEDKKQDHKDHPNNNDKPLLLCDRGNQAAYPDEPSGGPSAPWMPEKRILELILDILQRRDTHEIFAEPVDPEEVEDYYEIIKEPMDFGTMRAKLHEGLYTSLEQFEHDVFLISGNAMHFNSSTTIYFRQARAIHELSKKVFHALKTDPKNFESEFSETRRRTVRRLQSEARSPIYSSSHKHTTNLRTNSTAVNDSSKVVSNSLSGSSNLKRSSRGNTWCSSAATPFSERDPEMLPGAKDGRRTSFSDADRRSTYNTCAPFLNEYDSVVSTIHDNSKALKHVSQQDIGYRESLMLFVRDLGPTAQMIAERKLHGLSTASFQISNSNCWFQTPKCQTPAAFASAQQRPTALDTTFSSSISQNLSDHHQGYRTFPGNSSHRTDLCDIDKRGKAYTGDRLGTDSPSLEVKPNNDGRKIPSAFGRIICTSSAINAIGVLGSDKAHKGENNGINLNLNSSMAARELNFSVRGLKDAGEKSTMISDKNKLDNQAWSLDSNMEYSPSDMFKFNLLNNASSSSLSGPLQTTSMSTSCQTKASLSNLGSQCLRGDVGAIASRGQSHNELGSSGTSQAIESSQPLPLVSQFTFDLPYLKTRLDQINTSSRQDRLLQQCSGTGGSILEKMSYQRVDNHHQSSLDPKHTDLVLQL
ncbi:bromodomain-containing protein DDB_G0270170-like [Pistacia vera]|uniref:bromodomain-containing protein DDB_G0270170-like n=1 Tax=Pistacia vera TaxID=55513 RepID=UPI001263C8DA|nr:bromodomain-containing protein DDB_G0270170-like [Pistacia vera]